MRILPFLKLFFVPLFSHSLKSPFITRRNIAKMTAYTPLLMSQKTIAGATNEDEGAGGDGTGGDRQDGIPNNDVNHFSIYFYGTVNEESCLQLTNSLNELDIKAKHHKILYPSYEPHISLHIQSGGGSLMHTFYVCDTIMNLDTPVYTYVDGFVASAASLIAVSGKKKYMTKHSAILIHQLSSSTSGKLNEMKTEINNLGFFMNNVKYIYLNNTKLELDVLENLLTTDMWLDSNTCKNMGLVDEII